MRPDRLATAEWANPVAFAEKYRYRDGTFWLGRGAHDARHEIGHLDDRHICLVSGSRAGKGTTTIIPNLCLWPGSVVVIDPKGENATVTAARRAAGSDKCSGLGQRVHVLDPFRAAQVDDSLRSRFNPLDALDPNNPESIDEAARLADAIVVVQGDSKDPFWEESARSLVKGLLLHVLTAGEFQGRRDLLTLRELITRGDRAAVQALKNAGESDVPTGHQLLWEGVSRNEAFGGVIAGIGETFRNMALNTPKQFESVLQVANRNTEFLDSPPMQDCLRSSDFSISDLKTDPKGVSVYLSLPQRYMSTHFRWLRMMIALIVTEMEKVKGQPASGHRVLMCLDEFAGLKRMEVLETAVAQIAGFGVKLFFVLQSLEQLKATYEKSWETFLANAGLKVFFGLEDHFSREYVSKLIGETELTRVAHSTNQADNWQSSASTGTSTSDADSTTRTNGRSGGTNTSEGWGTSDSFKRFPILRDTAGFFRKLMGEAQASNSQHGSTGTHDGWSTSDAVGRTTTTGTSTQFSWSQGGSTGTGTSETFHKRPLITPDEIGLYMGRVNERDHPAYPGLGLVLIAGERPCVVKRTNYFEDRKFVERFQPSLDHPGLSKVSEYNIGFYGLDRFKYISGRFHPAYGPALPPGRWLVEEGGAIRRGDPILEVSQLVGDPPGKLVFRSPVDGQMLRAHTIDDYPEQYKWLMIVVGLEQEPDESIVEANNLALYEYCQKVVRTAQFSRAHHFVFGLIKVLVALGAIVWLILSWPGLWLGLAAIVGVLVLIGHTLRVSVTGAFMMNSFATAPIEDIEGVFIVEGPFRHNVEEEEKFQRLLGRA